MECSDSSGRAYFIERLAARVPLSDFEHDPALKYACEACPNYGKSLSCPPHSPAFAEHAEGAKTALVICLRVPTEEFVHIPLERRYEDAYAMLKRLLYEELLRYKAKGLRVAGSGECPGCDACAVESGECRNPGGMVFSLESLGVSVVNLVERAFGFKLEWSGEGNIADYVTAVGAVFGEDSLD